MRLSLPLQDPSTSFEVNSIVAEVRLTIVSGLSGGYADIKEIRACFTSYQELNAHVAGILRPFVPCISCDTSDQQRRSWWLSPNDNGLPRSWAAVSSWSPPLASLRYHETWGDGRG